MTARTVYADPARSELAAFYTAIADRLAAQWEKMPPSSVKARDKVYREGVAFRQAAMQILRDKP